MRPPSLIMAYHEASRRAYLFAGQTEAARWLITSGRHKGEIATARSNLVSASEWPGRTRSYHGFVWVRGSDVSACLMDKLVRRLRVWALMDADWRNASDATLIRALAAAGIADPACEPTCRSPLASGIRHPSYGEAA